MSSLNSILTSLAARPDGTQLLAAVQRSGAAAYLVGGAVRDFALGREPRELDVAVEGPLEPLIAALGGAARAHDRFETATVELGDGATIDLARTRAERYPKPGQLPEVRPAPLSDDLLRRDATINAIAVDLRDGTVHAVEHAVEDLSAGPDSAPLLRMLHVQSFVDDPTRIWRLARYAARLGAGWEAETEAAASAAAWGGALDTVTPERIGNELRLALREPRAVAVLDQLARLNAAPWLAKDLPLIESRLEIAPPDLAADELLLALVATPDPLLKLVLGRREEWRVIDAALHLESLAPLPFDAPGSAVAAQYEGQPRGAVAAGRDLWSSRRWFTQIEPLALEIDGDDLIAAGIAPGPALGERLARTLAALRDGELPADRDAQLAFALAQSC